MTPDVIFGDCYREPPRERLRYFNLDMHEVLRFAGWVREAKEGDRGALHGIEEALTSPSLNARRSMAIALLHHPDPWRSLRAVKRYLHLVPPLLAQARRELDEQNIPSLARVQPMMMTKEPLPPSPQVGAMETMPRELWAIADLDLMGEPPADEPPF